MIDPVLLAQTAEFPLEQTLQEPSTANTVTALGDAGLSIGLVLALKSIGSRAVMGYFLPDDMSNVDLSSVETKRDPTAIILSCLLYTLGVGLTGIAVHLTFGLPTALAYVGVGALVGSFVAGLIAKDALPLDHYRMLFEARRQNE